MKNAVYLIGTRNRIMATGDTLNLTGYKLTFDDEFNSFSSNGPANYLVTGGTGTWDTTGSYGERHLNDEQEFYSDPTVGVNPDSVSGGVLDIHAAPSANPANTWGLAPILFTLQFGWRR